MKSLCLIAVATCFGVVLLSGCLGRTGLGVDNGESISPDDGQVPTDVAPETSVTEEDTAINVVDTAVIVDTTVSPPDSWIDIFDVIPIPEGGPIGECAGCVRDKCGAKVNGCVNDRACVSGLACSIGKCIIGGGGGGPDFACLLGCFKGDFGAIAKAISAFTCVTGTCGPKCGGGFGGLPGLGGSGTGPGSGSAGSPGSSGPSAGAFDDFSVEQIKAIDPSVTFSVPAEAFSPWREQINAAACTKY